MQGFFRIVLAVVVGIGVFFLAAFGLVFLKWGREPSVREGSVLRLAVHGGMLEYPPGGYTSGLLASDAATLQGVLDNLAKARVDDRVTGVLLELGGVDGGFAKLDEIRQGISRVHEAGKPVWAWMDVVELKDLYLASACDSVFIHPTAYITLTGLYSEHTYLAGTLEKLGIVPEIHRIESYKSAAEPLLRRDMSPPAREMLGWIYADLYPRVLEALAQGRRVDRGTVEGALARSLFLPEELAATRLVDGVRHWDEMKAMLPRHKGDKEPRILEGSVYDDVAGKKVGLGGKKAVAVVHAEGLIGGAQSGRDPFFGLVMGYKDVNADLLRALENDDVAGVILRVDSPGGDALTSEHIGRMVETVDRKKPVVVSMVDVAASGGYHIAYRARTLVAGGSTITGSIGSITGKFNLHGLYDKLGITKDGAGIGPRGDLYSDYRSWTPEEWAATRDNHWKSYDVWIADIARIRKLAVAEVDSAARGRVWTGRQALERRLVDRLGGLDEAVLAAKEAAGIPADEEVTLIHYPQPEGVWASLLGANLAEVGETVVNRWVGARVASFQALERANLEILDLPVP